MKHQFSQPQHPSALPHGQQTAQFLPAIFRITLCLLVLIGGSHRLAALDTGPAGIDAYDVTWDSPGPSSQESMPIGNGDIGLNLWCEPNGDLVFYIGKTDSWGANVKGDQGLPKVGRVRVSIDPKPLAKGGDFRQVLKLRDGAILIEAGPADSRTMLRVWVDANHPVINVEASSRKPTALKVTCEEWRKGEEVLTADKRVVWFRRNGPDADAPVVNLTCGAAITGTGMTNHDARSLRSTAPATRHAVSIHVLTAITATVDDWKNKLDRQISTTSAVPLKQAFIAHRAWWEGFWKRSWVLIDGGPQSAETTRGYLLQRFVTACNGRGAYPIKFNGSIFVVDDPNSDKAQSKDADYRTWGGMYWFQNTRPMYWPRLAAGDFDMMLPLFRMYAAMLPANAAQVKKHYNHEGAYFAETAPFWGGLGYWGPEVKEDWTGHYFTPILELSMMMLDYYEYTGDKEFAKNLLLPVASAGMTFFDQHFKRDAQGKLLLDPVNSIEMFWKVHNPAPDIAGLRAVLPRLIVLPDSLVNASQRAEWKRLLNEVPPLPMSVNRRKTTLLPYTGPQTAQSRNFENPELYAVYPFRLYGLDRPNQAIANDSFHARRVKMSGCWYQDGIQAALLGMTETAKSHTVHALLNKAPTLKFPAFWARGNDYLPDQDNGGHGEHGLQSMLLSHDGKRILLLPAWPKDWDVDFRLHAPFKTTVSCRVEKGVITRLEVDPPGRRADVVECWKLPPLPEPPPRPVPGQVAGSVKSVLTQVSAIDALSKTKAGGPNQLSTEQREPAQAVQSAIDGSVESKHFNGTRLDGEAGGVGSGFVTTLDAPVTITAFQIATAFDVPDRDPLAITIEGSNDPAAGKDGTSGFTLLYQGFTGIDRDPGRKTWGPAVTFSNKTAYRFYRVLVTECRSDNTEAVQYSEIRLGNLER